MSNHYLTHDFPRTINEQLERRDRAEYEAGKLFAEATVEQHAIFAVALAGLRGLLAPRYDRKRDAARAEFDRTTARARELCEYTFNEYMQHGEISEATFYRWDELAVADAMLEAAE